MELRHLRYFVGIVEAGSLTKASKQLHVAQPALSVHLSNLEVELGVKLVVRSNRGIELTEDGALLYERAQVMLRYHDEALSTLKRRHHSPKGSVSIGLPSTLPDMIAAQLYKLCREELPEVRLYIADTLGEMALWYRAAGLCFVGGSLAPRGGHTPFEPAAAGSVILHGPSVENFAAPYQALERAGAALAFTGPADLTRALAPLIGDGAGQTRLADAARAALSAFRGQTDEEEFLAALARTTGLVIRAE